MKKIYIELMLIIAILILSININAQTINIDGDFIFTQNPETKGVNCQAQSQCYLTKYRYLDNYIPNNNTALKTVFVNLIIWQDNNGERNWQNTSGHITRLNQICDWVKNAYYNQNGTPSDTLTGVQDLSFKKVTMEFNYYFFQNSNFNSAGGTSSYPVSSMQNEIQSINPDLMNQLNIHITSTSGGFNGGWGFALGPYQPVIVTTDNPNNKSYTNCDFSGGIEGCPISAYPDNNPVRDYSFAHHLAHEIGHCISLMHTYYDYLHPSFCPESCDASYIDFLDDLFEVGASWCTTPGPGCDVCYHGNGDPWINNHDGITNNLMSANGGYYLSPKQLGKAHRALSLYPISNFTCGYSTTPLEITQNEIWDFEFQAYSDIIVKSGNILTIKCKVKMPPQGKIIVEPSARLVIDGGEVTKSNVNCGNIWKGVEVWGNYSSTQDARGSNGIPTYQGEVIIKNGGTISNAYTAISAIKDNGDGTLDWSKAGGIINANGANFINNRVGIWIGGYTNYHPYHFGDPNYKRINRSIITNCTFETNDDFIQPVNFHSFIGLCGGSGINITANDFTNSISDPSFAGKGIGIISYNFSLNVRSKCTTITIPCSNYKPNIFTGLIYGIEIFNNDPGVKTSIIDNDFINCYRGIYLDNTYSAVVTNNNFEVAAFCQNIGYGLDALPYGLHLFGGKGFKVEENNFSNYGDYAGTRGIVISNTLATNNEIYNNIFEDLNIGIQPQFINKGKIKGIDVGLCLFCNEFDNPSYDVWVAGKDDSPVGTQNIGIAPAQQISNSGSSTNPYLPAGNEFTFTHSLFDYDFSNDDAEFLTYYHEDDTPTEKYEPTNYSNLTLDNADWGTVQRCQSKTGNGNNNTQNYTALSSAKIAYNSSKLILDIWKDGGLEDLGEEVETTDPWDAYVQFNELMSMSPYLSEDALVAMVENPVFTSLMVKLVMVANPQSSHSDIVMEAIYNRIPAMPESYIDEILAGEDGYSPLEQLEANVSADYHLIRSIGEDIKRVYRTDTTNIWAKDSLIAFVSRQSGLADQYEIAATYLQYKQFNDMNSVLNNIPNLFELDEQETANYQNYLITFAIAADIAENEKAPGSLNETQTTNLGNIMQTEEIVDKSMALALLKWNNPDYEYYEVILEPSESSARKARPNPDKMNTEDKTLFKVFPNPANDYITLEYRTSGKSYNILSVIIKDAGGRNIIEMQLIGGDNEELIDTQKLKNGLYTVLLYGDNNIISAEKLTIIK